MLIPHITDVLGWLPYCCCGYATYLVVSTLWKGKQPEHAARWMKFLASVRKAKGKVKGVASFVPVWEVALALCVCTVLVYAATRPPQFPVAVEHNVAVLASLGDNEWRMHSDEEGEFVYRACPDFPNATVIWVGYIADRAKWQEKGECKSIRDTGFGFYYREGHNDWRTTNAGTAR